MPFPFNFPRPCQCLGFLRQTRVVAKMRLLDWPGGGGCTGAAGDMPTKLGQPRHWASWHEKRDRQECLGDIRHCRASGLASVKYSGGKEEKTNLGYLFNLRLWLMSDQSAPFNLSLQGIKPPNVVGVRSSLTTTSIDSSFVLWKAGLITPWYLKGKTLTHVVSGRWGVLGVREMWMVDDYLGGRFIGICCRNYSPTFWRICAILIPLLFCFKIFLYRRFICVSKKDERPVKPRNPPIL